MTPDERRAQHRSTWKLLALGVVSNLIGCGVHYAIWPLRFGGAIPRPAAPLQVELRTVERGKP